jgi:hypothetical protein
MINQTFSPHVPRTSTSIVFSCLPCRVVYSLRGYVQNVIHTCLRVVCVLGAHTQTIFPLGIPTRLDPPAHPPPKKKYECTPEWSATLTPATHEVWETIACMQEKSLSWVRAALVSFSCSGCPRHAAGPVSARACGRFSRPSSDKHEGHNVLARAHRERRAHSVSRPAAQHITRTILAPHVRMHHARCNTCTPRAMHSTAMHTAMSDAHTIHIPIHTN